MKKKKKKKKKEKKKTKNKKTLSDNEPIPMYMFRICSYRFVFEPIKIATNQHKPTAFAFFLHPSFL
jgi:hypothetical protein